MNLNKHYDLIFFCGIIQVYIKVIWYKATDLQTVHLNVDDYSDSERDRESARVCVRWM